MDKKDFMTIHGGYDRAFVTEDPDLVVPLDVLRELEKEGEFGELANYFITTTGTGTSTGNASASARSLFPSCWRITSLRLSSPPREAPALVAVQRW